MKNMKIVLAEQNNFDEVKKSRSIQSEKYIQSIIQVVRFSFSVNITVIKIF